MIWTSTYSITLQKETGQKKSKIYSMIPFQSNQTPTPMPKKSEADTTNHHSQIPEATSEPSKGNLQVIPITHLSTYLSKLLWKMKTPIKMLKQLKKSSDQLNSMTINIKSIKLPKETIKHS